MAGFLEIASSKQQPMTKAQLINQTLEKLSELPGDKVQEAYDFVDFLLKRSEEDVIQHGATNLMRQSQTFQFLEEEEDLYSSDDLKERYR
jgi:hypothetical protein